MQKQAPTVGRLLTMVLFALSCFGLLLFLWLSFGGPVPFKPKAYRVEVAFPEATQLGLEADVRVAGVRVGKVKAKDLDPKGNRTIATLEINPRYAPIRKDAKAVLRQKTLLGETYVELTPGNKGTPTIPENGRLANSRVADTVQLDEILKALDPTTRQAFRTWQQDLSKAVNERGTDLNDVIGNLPDFAKSGSDLLDVLNTQQGAVQRLFKNTGIVFAALTQREDALRNLITNSHQTFSAIASQNDALAETFKIFPTFLDESKKVQARLETFSLDTRPLVRDLRPVMRDLRPTLRAVRKLSPDLVFFFQNLDKLITVSKTGLPALTDTLKGLRPLLGSLQPFLEQLNPIFEFLELYDHTVADFMGGAGSALGDTVPSRTPGAIGHYLRQFGPSGAESAAIWPTRLSTNRGITYPPPLYQSGRARDETAMYASFDCKNTGAPGDGSVKKEPGNGTPGSSHPACFVANPFNFQGKTLRFPHVDADSYAAPGK
jgi:virulence factor Mce-like protein